MSAFSLKHLKNIIKDCSIRLCSSVFMSAILRTEGVKILLLGMKGIYNVFSECMFLEDMKLCRLISC